jgi:cation diffusion facilitator CzcD-associated flavoprotein CzcO
MMDLAQLESAVADDLKKITHPGMPWIFPHQGPDGEVALDVLIVGGGQSGVVTAFGLKRSRIDNVMVIDQAPEGKEGPWVTYARMQTLRNPKDYTGPDLDIPNMTCQSWFEASFGKAAWDALDMLPRQLWNEYLLWIRKVAGITVHNGTKLLGLTQAGELIRAELLQGGVTHTVYARKVVLATGQESMGQWALAPHLEKLPAARRACTGDEIDFSTLKGKTVVVVGAGASAFDNAATALEAGAKEVKLLCRRLLPQVVQPYRWLTFRGFLRHFSDLSDAWRWRFMHHILGLREGFTQQTYDRCMQHANFFVLNNASVRNAGMEGDSVVLDTDGGSVTCDYVISATGIQVDFASRPELSGFAGNIANWLDRYSPPEHEKDSRIGKFPYLNDDYSFAERVPGQTPWIRNIHLFAIGSTVSFGASGSSINALTTAVPKLVSGLGRGLFCDDAERYWESLCAYDVPQAILHDREHYHGK